MNYDEKVYNPTKCIEFILPIHGVDSHVYAKIHEGSKTTTIVCCEEGRYCMYLMSGIPDVSDATEIQSSFFEQRFNFVLNILK